MYSIDAVYDERVAVRRARAAVAIVVRDSEIPSAHNVLGVITNEQIADSVADSVDVYAGGS